MAEIQYGEVGVDAPAGNNGNLSLVINWLGALISVSLIIGLAWWGYQLMVRDVSGVPVVRALEGPMRIAPEDPGGSSAEYQGLAVNNIPAVGEAEAPADRLVLAPKPTALTGEDQTAAAMGEVTAVEPLSASVEPVVDSQETTAPLALSDVAESQEPVVSDQAAQIEAALLQIEGISPNSVQPLATEAVASTVPGVARSLMPMLRPVALQVAPPTGDAPVADAVKSMDSGSIPVGTRLAQLGAFETADIAKSEWLKISAKFEEFMGDKARVIEQAQSGGKVFYRLRAHGFADLSDARRFCSALLAAQANCIPVVTR